jgi:hypothetical protein
MHQNFALKDLHTILYAFVGFIMYAFVQNVQRGWAPTITNYPRNIDWFTVKNREDRLRRLLFITAVPNTKLCAWGEEDSGGHV